MCWDSFETEKKADFWTIDVLSPGSKHLRVSYQPNFNRVSSHAAYSRSQYFKFEYRCKQMGKYRCAGRGDCMVEPHNDNTIRTLTLTRTKTYFNFLINWFIEPVTSYRYSQSCTIYAWPQTESFARPNCWIMHRNRLFSLLAIALLALFRNLFLFFLFIFRLRPTTWTSTVTSTILITECVRGDDGSWRTTIHAQRVSIPIYSIGPWCGEWDALGLFEWNTKWNRCKILSESVPISMRNGI